MGTDIHGTFQAKENETWKNIPTQFEFNRHYQLFAVLAGVRNGYGFAGVVTGDPVTPIAEPRGIPSDFDRNSWESNAHEWLGNHSYSWLTAEEMLSWRGPTVRKTGVLSRTEYFQWDHKTRPDSYCDGVSGGDTLVISDNDQKDNSRWTHVQVSWEQNLNEELSYFFDEVKRLKELHGEVRFVFGFDS